MAVVAISLYAILWIDFQITRQRVLGTDPKTLARLGRHLVVGYRDIAEIEPLLALDAVGGVYITSRNFEGLSSDEAAQVAHRLRAKSRLGDRLLIMADQEGGGVSRLSPPLERLPTLATVLERTGKKDREGEVRNYARTQAAGMHGMGFNLNLAPVVDVNRQIISAEDKYTRIYQRAISSDPEVISQVAAWYCDELRKNGVTCTLKHFPGLGRVTTDTHVADAVLDASVEDLEKSDWKPFRHLMQAGMPVMLAHARLNSIDPMEPASISNKVVDGLLRRSWQFQGIIMTDDFSMNAIRNRDGGVGGAAVKALNAGVDLILVTYRPELYYQVMEALIDADREGRLDRVRLQQSTQRIEGTLAK